MRDLGILVVDNNRENLDVIERMFRYFRIKVDSFTSVTSALESLQNRHYKTMIIDIDLQEMVGLELAHAAKEINPDMNIVLYVADNAEQIIRLTLDPTVSDISVTPLLPCKFGDMLLELRQKETGKIFLLE